jgi:hypothetical protein
VITSVWERLYIGSLKDAAQLATENPFGITAVVSLCSHKVPRKARGLSYTRIVIADSSPISARQFDAVMAAIAQGVRHGKLLIHCLGGVNRSPIMAAAWLHRCGCLEPRRGAARNNGASSDHRPVARITAKRGGAPTPMKRAVLYSRVSSPDQNPQMQLLDLRPLAAARGLEIVGEYSVGHNGSTTAKAAILSCLGIMSSDQMRVLRMRISRF